MKQYSAKRNIQILAHVLKEYGLKHIVLSPGSRNAPIAIHFSEDDFLCYSIVDERSAGFVALGMAKSLQKPVAMSCTSGSATANYYPAIVEAFYQNIPLLIITADRPVDMIDHFDGQTIRQKDMYAQHCYGSFQLEENDDEFNLMTVQEAMETCIRKSGPVHINVPLTEPLYEFVAELPILPEVTKTASSKTKYEILPRLVGAWNASKKILILLGTLDPSSELHLLLEQLVKNHSAVVLTEMNSNQYHPKFFNHIDRYIFDFEELDFKNYGPDLLITVGQNVVSKKVKQFLRKSAPLNHWHVDPYWHPDTYFSLTESIDATHEEFFVSLIKHAKLEPQPYFNLWDVRRDKKDAKHRTFVDHIEFSDLAVFHELSEEIPKDYKIHVANSSAIRYAQLFEFSKNHEFYCNRGTSGIDGCTSTAMGFAMMEEDPTVLITGDLAFLYDINGLWSKYIPPYTRIVLINNGGGDIFRIIPGPSEANALEEFIATSHSKNASLLAKHFGFDYFEVSQQTDFSRAIQNFFKPSLRPKILEVNTKAADNAAIQKGYFKALE